MLRQIAENELAGNYNKADVEWMIISAAAFDLQVLTVITVVCSSVALAHFWATECESLKSSEFGILNQRTVVPTYWRTWCSK